MCAISHLMTLKGVSHRMNLTTRMLEFNGEILTGYTHFVLPTYIWYLTLQNWLMEESKCREGRDPRMEPQCLKVTQSYGNPLRLKVPREQNSSELSDPNKRANSVLRVRT